MNDRIKLFLNCDEELQKRIKIFIDYFVRYYGEDKREEVENYKKVCASKSISNFIYRL